MSESATAREVFGIVSKLGFAESGKEDASLVVRKYDGDMANWVTKKSGITHPREADFRRFKVRPYQELVAYGNLITTTGWQRILGAAIASGLTIYDVGHARIGVGTSAATAVVADTDLYATTASASASANRLWQGVDAVGTTSTAGGTVRLSMVATFASSQANFVWAEWGIDQGTGGNTATATASTMGAAQQALLNHKGQALGTKATPAVWTATAQLDFT